MYQKTKIDMLKLNSNKKRSPPAHLPGRLLPYPTIAHAWPPPREHRAHSTADFQCSFSSSSQLIPMAVLTLTTPQPGGSPGAHIGEIALGPHDPKRAHSFLCSRNNQIYHRQELCDECFAILADKSSDADTNKINLFFICILSIKHES